MFSRRTIKKAEAVTSVDTASEALAVSLSEKAKVDLDYMAELAGKSTDTIKEELAGIIFSKSDYRCMGNGGCVFKRKCTQ